MNGSAFYETLVDVTFFLSKESNQIKVAAASCSVKVIAKAGAVLSEQANAAFKLPFGSSDSICSSSSNAQVFWSKIAL
jgi:hypothetical protein